MIQIVYSRRALLDLDRSIDFLRALDEEMPSRAAETILQGIEMLGAKPYVGRRVRGAIREFVISFGRNGYVALYRIRRGRVEILGLRHQREAGFRH